MEHSCQFSINDNSDILAEILCRLDGRSLGVAALVCRLWSAVCRRDAVWESVCVRTVPSSSSSSAPRARGVVSALGGYRRLYRTCVGPMLGRLASSGWAEPSPMSLSVSMSLFSIDCYERLWLKESPAGAAAAATATATSLLFLTSNAVDVA